MRHPSAALAFASTLLVVAGCTKEPLEDCPGHCTLLTGQLLTSGLQPLAGIPVTAKWSSGHSLINQLRTKARATTDVQGRYQVRFLVQDDELHRGSFQLTYEADPARYYVLSNTDQPDTGGADLKRDTTYRLAPYLIPRKAFVQLTVPNPAQIQQSFSVDFTGALQHALTATKHSLGGGASIGIAPQNNPFTTVVEIAGDQTVYVRATRSGPNGPTSTVDSLVVPAGTTRALTVRY
jgi:hypothetical protein